MWISLATLTVPKLIIFLPYEPYENHCGVYSAYWWSRQSLIDAQQTECRKIISLIFVFGYFLAWSLSLWQISYIPFHFCQCILYQGAVYVILVSCNQLSAYQMFLVIIGHAQWGNVVEMSLVAEIHAQVNGLQMWIIWDMPNSNTVKLTAGVMWIRWLYSSMIWISWSL